MPTEQPALEAQLGDLVDEIAYNNHDVDDGLASGMLRPEELAEVELWARALEAAKKKYTKSDLPEIKHATISIMISLMVEDLIIQTSKNIDAAKVKTLADIRKQKV